MVRNAIGYITPYRPMVRKLQEFDSALEYIDKSLKPEPDFEESRNLRDLIADLLNS